ncbi:glucosaminidase domain-containing protein [Yunchengibacter salinarum]|uniref:glucosaminidase domain-containing protein n=1 Tax=Yunchengibacter salinarum TaxID=3133399 RepID=UPI0035B59A31
MQILKGRYSRLLLGGGAVIIVAAVLTLIYGLYKWQESVDTLGVGYRHAEDLTITEDMTVEERKQAFFDFMRPIVKAENRRISALRDRLQAARQDKTPPAWVADVAENYGVDWSGEGRESEWRALLRRVDTVPLPLVLAQAANESSWGRSRFARKGNNFFGQWCFSKGCGIVPKRRSAGKNHEVASFDTVNAAVRAYLHNINTSGAYGGLRDIRYTARQQARKPKAEALAAGLTRYSERGAAYVSEIRAMIRVNTPLMMQSQTAE